MYKNINLNNILSASVGRDEFNNLSLNGIFDTVSSADDTTKFNLAVFGNVDLNNSYRDDCIQIGEEYRMCVEVVHINTNKAVVIADFDMKVLPDDVDSEGYYEFTAVVGNIIVKFKYGSGEYRVNTYIKHQSEDKWKLQVSSKLNVRCFASKE